MQCQNSHHKVAVMYQVAYFLQQNQSNPSSVFHCSLDSKVFHSKPVPPSTLTGEK